TSRGCNDTASIVLYNNLFVGSVRCL
ncbi:sortase B protein-sorting domain-containing protein, partial [Salmonella enterica subsp. enterica serovar Goldcoast]